jgi:hypothetical protein
MKKVSGILTALLPVIYAVCIGCFILIDPDDEILLSFIGIFILFSIAVCIAYASLGRPADSHFLAKMNLWIIGTNLLLFIAEIVFFDRLHHSGSNRCSAGCNGRWAGYICADHFLPAQLDQLFDLPFYRSCLLL